MQSLLHFKEIRNKEAVDIIELKMLLEALLISLLSLSMAQDHNDDSGVYAPYPYSFGYDTTDESGTRLTQSETGDEDNVKRGSYSYSDANGLYRVVNYIADKDGFRVTIDTNEPGTKTSAPAGVQINSQAVEPPHPVGPPTLASAKPLVPATVMALTPVPVVLPPVPTSSPSAARFVAPVTFNEHSFLVQPQQVPGAAVATGREGAGTTRFALGGNVPLTYTFGKAP